PVPEAESSPRPDSQLTEFPLHALTERGQLPFSFLHSAVMGEEEPHRTTQDVPSVTPHKNAVRSHFDRLAPDMHRWRRKSWYYHRDIEAFTRFVIPPGSSVLELGSGTGELLAALKPREGVGVDISPGMVEVARKRFPDLEWIVGDAEAASPGRTFDYVVMSDLLGHLE